MYAVASGDLVPQVFQTHRPFHIAVRQKRGCNFSANCNPAMSSLYAFGCIRNEIAYHFRAANGIRHIIDGQSRKHIRGVQQNTATLLDGSSYVHTICFQYRKEAGSVCLGRDYDDYIPNSETVFNKASIAVHHRNVVRVKRNLMAMSDGFRVVVSRCAGIVTRQADTEERFPLKNGLHSG